MLLIIFLKNGDKHLKNFSLIYDNRHEVKLAPAYEVVSTCVYIKNDILALLLLGSKKWLKRNYLIRFGIESCDLSAKQAKELYDSCLDALKEVLLELNQRLQVENDNEVINLLILMQGIYGAHFSWRSVNVILLSLITGVYGLFCEWNHSKINVHSYF